MIRLLLVCCGHLLVVIGIIGVFIPLLPTTPFLILAAACYARGSQALHDWLREHPRLGPPLVAWQDHGVIRLRAKILAVGLITLSLGYALVFRDFDWRLKMVAGTVGLLCVLFICNRPSRRRNPTAAGEPPP